MHELRARNQSQSLFVRAMSAAWRNGVQLHDPSIWLLRDPEVEEKMLRDADIAHAVGYRKHLIAGRDWTLTPSDESSNRSDLAVDVGTALVKHIGHFTQVRLNLARAFFSGARFGKIILKPMVLDIGDGKRRTWLVPISVRDEDKRMYRTVPQHDGAGGVLTGATWDKWSLVSNEWLPQTRHDTLTTIRHVYEDSQSQLGHGTALRESLGWFWYAKEHVFQESLVAVERFAQGIIHAKIDGVRDAATGQPNTELVAKWQAVLEDLRARHVIVSDTHDSIEIIKGNSEGYQLLSEMRAELKNTIYTLVMGANLTTAAAEGGSYALAEIQENSTEALIQYDRETLQETLTDDLLGCIWKKNWPNLVELGIEQDRPEFAIVQERRQEPKERAEVAEIVSRMGVQLSRDDVLEQTGFRIPEEGEEVITPPAPPDPFGGGGLGGPDPFALPSGPGLTQGAPAP